MAKINKLLRVFTHEGARGKRFTPEMELKRTLMNCLLWEDQFYEDGVAIADRIKTLVPQVAPEKVAQLAIEAREQMKLRHAPLLVVREMARHEKHRVLVADTLARVIQRPDEMTELLAIYWADALGPMQQRKRQPVSAQIKKGLARALTKFDAYQLAKYDRDGAVRIKDVLFLVHAKPKDAAQEKLWMQLVDGELNPPDTWEVALSAGKDKKATFERLISAKKLGDLALLRNLRNMENAKVDPQLVEEAILDKRGADKVCRSAMSRRRARRRVRARSGESHVGRSGAAPETQGQDHHGRRCFGQHVSFATVRTQRHGPRNGGGLVGRHARELCQKPKIYATAGNDAKRIHATKLVPPRHGMALIDAIYGLCQPLGGGGIFLKQVMDFLAKEEVGRSHHRRDR